MLNNKSLKQTIIDKLVNSKPGTLINELRDPVIFEKLINEEIRNEKEIKKPLYDSKKYTFNGKKYNYLSNDRLNKDFQMTFQENTNKNFKINLCLFRLNNDCKEPFLQFFIELEETINEKNMIFPNFQLNENDFYLNESDIDDEEEEEKNKMQLIFEKLCFQKFKEITNVSDDIIKEIYRGYITEYDNTIYPLFDCTYIKFNKKENQVWCILDEFINEQHIYDYIIDRNIFVMFMNNEYLAYIKDEENEQINLPCCLYLVKKTEDGNDYENVLKKENKDFISLIDPKINHEILGNHYFFTTDPINPDKSLKLKRFSTFIDNSLYFLNITTPLSDIDIDGDFLEAEKDEHIKTHKDFTCIYFFENNKQLWCIKDMTRFTEQ